MPPRFSVVIPVFNRAKSVGPTLESVRAQTFHDFECIVVDDGSADGEELKSVVETLGDARFRYVRRENGGGGAARNTGIDEAKGEYIAFLDSDDRWLPEKLERDAEACAENRVLFSPVLVERGGRIVGRRPKWAPRVGEPIAEYLACADGWVPASSISVPRDLLSKVRWNESITFGDDTDFAMQLAAANAEFRMLNDAWSVVRDDESDARLSRSTDWKRVLNWLDQIRPSIGDRAYLAYRGRHVARLAADAGRYPTALRYYAAGLRRGAFGPSLAVKALAQVLMRRSFYARFRH